MTEIGRVNNARDNPDALYGILLHIAEGILPGFLAKRGLGWYPEDDRETIAHDATVRLMERILRRGASYKIKYIRTVVRQELVHQVYDPERVRWGQLGDLLEYDQPDDRIAPPADDERFAFSDLMDQPDGRRIILEIYFARTFKGLILRLATFKSRGWIYDHVAAISSVYKNTRAMKCRERKRGRPMESPGTSPLTRILTRPFRST